jgi:hypothetical protein
VVCNRLHIRSPEIRKADLQAWFEGWVFVAHEPGVERGVVGAWNKGGELALADGTDYIATVANDTAYARTALAG